MYSLPPDASSSPRRLSSSPRVSGSTTSPRSVMRDHRAEDPAMALGVEHRVVDMLTGAEDRIRVHEHRREHRLLGLRSTEERAVAVRITRWRSSSIRRASWTSSQVGRFHAGLRRSAAG